jgi:hypothetical protein
MSKSQSKYSLSNNLHQLAQLKALASALSYSLQPPIGVRTMVLSWQDAVGINTYYLPYANGCEIIKAVLPYVDSITITDYDNYQYNRDAQ